MMWNIKYKGDADAVSNVSSTMLKFVVKPQECAWFDYNRFISNAVFICTLD